MSVRTNKITKVQFALTEDSHHFTNPYDIKVLGCKTRIARMLRIRMGGTQRLTWLGLPRGDWRYKTRPGRGHSVYTTYCRQWKQNN